MGSITTKRLLSKSSQHASSMSANKADLKDTARLPLQSKDASYEEEEHSVVTYTLKEAKEAEGEGHMTSQLSGAIPILNQKDGTKINVGASYTFYNDAEAEQVTQGGRPKATSQMHRAIAGTASPEESANGAQNNVNSKGQ